MKPETILWIVLVAMTSMTAVDMGSAWEVPLEREYALMLGQVRAVVCQTDAEMRQAIKDPNAIWVFSVAECEWYEIKQWTTERTVTESRVVKQQHQELVPRPQPGERSQP